MFWAVTCEAGKRYSQVPTDSFHVSMAALEPKDPLPENKLVSLMIEHGGKEFLLCTLEYGKVLQVALDLRFNKKEETFFFVNGDGTIHLSGYVDNSIDTYPVKKVNCVDTTNNGAHFDEASLQTSRLLLLDSSEEEDSGDDYEPEIDVDAEYALQENCGMNSRVNDFGYSDSDEDEEEAYNDSEDLESELSIDNTEGISGSSKERKRKKLEMPGPSSKCSKGSSGSRQDSGSSNSSSKKAKKLKVERNSMSNNVSMETHANSSIDEDMNSSIGRTPMPKKSGSVKTPTFASPNLVTSTKTLQSAKKNKPSATELENNSKPEEKKVKTIIQGVEVEDLKLGQGPMAKKGKFVHVFYVGKLENNQVFDSLKPGRDKPLSFRLGKNEVIKGWDIGIEGMRVGGKRFMKVPPELAYGKKGQGPIPGNSTLVFIVELKSVT